MSKQVLLAVDGGARADANAPEAKTQGATIPDANTPDTSGAGASAALDQGVAQLPGNLGSAGPGGPSSPGAGSIALPHGIRGSVALYPPWAVGLFCLVIAALLGWLSVWLVRRWRRWRRGRPQPVSDPWDLLQQRLQTLRPETPFTKKAQEDYYSRLSLILREAVERATGLPATDRTYQELKVPLRLQLPLAKEEVEGVLGFLERADLVKFAAAPSGDEEALSRTRQVSAWVQALRPAPLAAHSKAEGPKTTETEAALASS